MTINSLQKDIYNDHNKDETITKINYWGTRNPENEFASYKFKETETALGENETEKILDSNIKLGKDIASIWLVSEWALEHSRKRRKLS